MSGYILTRDVNEKEWKEGMKVEMSGGRVQRVSDGDDKSPFLTLLWFEQLRKANQVACWKVSYKSDEIDSYEYQMNKGVVLVKSFTLVERQVSHTTEFDGELPLQRTGKAVFYHGFLVGTSLPERPDGSSLVSIVYDPKSSPNEGVEIPSLDAYLARHSVLSIVGDLHAVRK